MMDENVSEYVSVGVRGRWRCVSVLCVIQTAFC